MTIHQKNWADNYMYQAPQWYMPSTVQEVQSIIRDSQSIKGLGSRHSFNHVRDSMKPQCR